MAERATASLLSAANPHRRVHGRPFSLELPGDVALPLSGRMLSTRLWWPSKTWDGPGSSVLEPGSPVGPALLQELSLGWGWTSHQHLDLLPSNFRVVLCQSVSGLHCLGLQERLPLPPQSHIVAAPWSPTPWCQPHLTFSLSAPSRPHATSLALWSSRGWEARVSPHGSVPMGLENLLRPRFPPTMESLSLRALSDLNIFMSVF